MSIKSAVILMAIVMLCISTLAALALGEENTASYWFEKGMKLYKSGSYENAADNFQKATELDPNCSQCWYFRGLALSYEKEPNHEEAIKCYDKALQINPTNEDALNNKGYSLGELGEYSEALKFIKMALQINSSDPDAWDNEGIIYVYMHNYDEALKCFDKTIALKPGWGDPYYNKGYALKEMGRISEADTYFAKAGELGTSAN